jgi:hypothetical protein
VKVSVEKKVTKTAQWVGRNGEAEKEDGLEKVKRSQLLRFWRA